MIVINKCYYASRDLLGILFIKMYIYKILNIFWQHGPTQKLSRACLPQQQSHDRQTCAGYFRFLGCFSCGRKHLLCCDPDPDSRD